MSDFTLNQVSLRTPAKIMSEWSNIFGAVKQTNLKGLKELIQNGYITVHKTDNKSNGTTLFELRLPLPIRTQFNCH